MGNSSFRVPYKALRSNGPRFKGFIYLRFVMNKEGFAFVIEDVPVVEPPRPFKERVFIEEGMRFNRYTVLKRVENNKWKESVWLCRCDCGVEKTVVGKLLISGNTSSCGCLRIDRIREVTEHQRVHKVCKVCGKGFTVKLSHSNVEGVYCSMDCKVVGLKITMIGSGNPNYRHGKAHLPGTYYHQTIQWRKRNKAKVANYNRHSKARRYNAEGWHTKDDIFLKLALQKGLCFWCFEPLIEYHVDHIYPLSKGGSNNPDNLCISCPTCNTQKRAMLPDEWMKSGKSKRTSL